MKLTLVGGGGFRVPQLLEAIAQRPAGQIDVTELCLYDVSEQRLRVMMAVLKQMRVAREPQITAAGSIAEAVRGADFVFSAIRVGGTGERVTDELVPLSHGILGQETVGPGGYSYALRTIPVALELARTVAREAPGAWVVNFTNPAGIITQAMRTVFGQRVIGICDTPIGLVTRVARALQIPEEELDYDYVGLNHLGWLRSVSHGGKELLPTLLESDALLDQIEETRLIGREWVRALGVIPNEYLFYYYRNREAVAQIRAQKNTRGQFLARQQEAFYARAAADLPHAWELWQAAHAQREATYMAEARDVAHDGARRAADTTGGYQEVALNVMSALSGGPSRRMILNVANAHAGARVIPALADDAVVEIPCTVDSSGPVPCAIAPVEGAQLGLIAQVKACESAVIQAVIAKDRAAAWQAIALHPLVDSVVQARQILDEYCERIPEVAAVFER
ncbi:MAG: 6-phospho-beta-glucosidase [Ancrocorticia sp.]|jgi:6-phospho-beta-glucosidase|nr:6-phospho-beta-glucosidase [Ancrocorticia sp.]MCI2192669.1 6-phospho-beta-glucosidase [Ancrocorticia sp.]MCI2199265.1 6-phospho-beta-glucosidase [Ancrocorticia sp.]